MKHLFCLIFLKYDPFITSACCHNMDVQSIQKAQILQNNYMVVDSFQIIEVSFLSMTLTYHLISSGIVHSFLYLPHGCDI
jgi:hypothetical protein